MNDDSRDVGDAGREWVLAATTNRLAKPIRSRAWKHCSTVAYNVPMTRSSSASDTASTASSPRRKTASSMPIEKWAPTSRSLRRSRCS